MSRCGPAAGRGASRWSRDTIRTRTFFLAAPGHFATGGTRRVEGARTVCTGLLLTASAYCMSVRRVQIYRCAHCVTSNARFSQHGRALAVSQWSTPLRISRETPT